MTAINFRGGITHDINLQRQHTVHFYGKGRKERVVPLWLKTVRRLKEWLLKIPKIEDTPLLPNRLSVSMTRSGVRQRLLVAQQQAIKYCPSLSARKITPHTLRHTTAMHLLQSGVDLSLIALWLGYEQIDTTHLYMEAILDMKRVALESLNRLIRGL
jgi:integrase/recombinase XerD